MKMNEETHCALIQLWFYSNQHLTFHLRPLFLPERGKAKKKTKKQGAVCFMRRNIMQSRENITDTEN